MDDETVEAHRAVAERVETTSAAVERIESRNRRLGRVRLVVLFVWLAAITVGLAVSLFVVISKQDAQGREALRQEQEILRVAKADGASLLILQQATGPDATARNEATTGHAIACIEWWVSHEVKGVPMPADCPPPSP